MFHFLSKSAYINFLHTLCQAFFIFLFSSFVERVYLAFLSVRVTILTLFILVSTTFSDFQQHFLQIRMYNRFVHYIW